MSVCPRLAEGRAALATLLQAALDTEHDIEADLAAGDLTSARFAEGYLVSYVDAASSASRGCG
jgi:hypothetical protein